MKLVAAAGQAVPTIRCTKRLLDEMGLRISETPKETTEGPFLGDWYCNLLRIDRRKALLFTNAETLYAFWVPRIKKADLEDFGTLFATHLSANLAHEGIPQLHMIFGRREAEIWSRFPSH